MDCSKNKRNESEINTDGGGEQNEWRAGREQKEKKKVMTRRGFEPLPLSRLQYDLVWKPGK